MQSHLSCLAARGSTSWALCSPSCRSASNFCFCLECCPLSTFITCCHQRRFSPNACVEHCPPDTFIEGVIYQTQSLWAVFPTCIWFRTCGSGHLVQDIVHQSAFIEGHCPLHAKAHTQSQVVLGPHRPMSSHLQQACNQHPHNGTYTCRHSGTSCFACYHASNHHIIVLIIILIPAWAAMPRCT